MRMLEWNIHGATGYGNYSIPEFVADEIMERGTEIVILTEFVMLGGWDYLRGVLKKKYKLFCSPYVCEQNGVLIAIRKDISDFDTNSARVSSDLNTTQTEKPNFLQVEVNKVKDKQSIFIIGTRIRDTNHIAQFRALKDHMDSLPEKSKILCAGDFNEWKNHVANKLGRNLTVFTPSFEMETNDFDTVNTWSAVLKNKATGKTGKALIDHIIAKNIKVTNEEYTWDFVNKSNGYGAAMPEDYKSNMIGLPDHAILTATIEI